MESLSIRQIVDSILAHGGITIKRIDACTLVPYRGPGIAVGLDQQAALCDDREDVVAMVAAHALSGNLSGHIGYWLESCQPDHLGPWPADLHCDRVAVIPDRTWQQVSYACALAVQYGQKSVYHFGTSVCVDVLPAAAFRPGRVAVWFDVMTIGPENLIAIHADSHLAFGGTPLPDYSCSLWRGYRGEVEYVPLDDDGFTDWYRESSASSYFKHRASDRQSQTRRVACRKLGGGK
jgi:hypothetical protein